MLSVNTGKVLVIIKIIVICCFGDKRRQKEKAEQEEAEEMLLEAKRREKEELENMTSSSIKSERKAPYRQDRRPARRPSPAPQKTETADGKLNGHKGGQQTYKWNNRKENGVVTHFLFEFLP